MNWEDPGWSERRAGMRPLLDVCAGSGPAGSVVLQEEFERWSPRPGLLPYFYH